MRKIRKPVFILALAVAIAVILLGFSLVQPKQPPTVTPAGESPCIESCDSEGNTKDIFEPGESVYLKGSGLVWDSSYTVYIVVDHSPWVMEDTELEYLDIIVEVTEPIEIDDDGYIIDQPVLIWDSASPGLYDIFADNVDEGVEGLYDEWDDIDDLDVIDEGDAGFFVVPETPLGTIAVLLSIFTAVLLKRKRIL